MSSHGFISRSLVAGLAAAALAASSAAAGPPLDPIVHVSSQEQQVLASRGQGAPEPVSRPVTHVVVPQAQSAGDSGFDWGDAGIGAGIAGGVMLLFGSAGLAQRRGIHFAR
jgi:hypothetical protein